MNVTEISHLIDTLIFEHTDKHLDDVQKAVIEGTWQGQTYKEIGKQCNRSKHHVRDVGYQLWQLLSEALGEDIKKSNFRSNIERLQLTSSQVININTIESSYDFRFCLYTDKSEINHQDNNKKIIDRDLSLAPIIINFYDRETELNTLSNWIFNENISLISVLGLFGIGKTTLVKRFIDLNLQQFEVIIWKTLKFPKSLDLLLNDLLEVCQQEPKESTDDKIRQLLNTLIEKKFLIVLDDVQNIFITGEFSGQYQTEYQDYQNFFKLITEVKHQSHFILISQEKCSEMNSLDNELYLIKCLELLGIENVELLKNKNLKDEDTWLKLITLYESNPIYLKDIAVLINDIYAGHVSEFLADDNLVITTNMQYHFRQLFNRLSSPEKELILNLSKFDTMVTREKLRQDLELSSTDFINSLQSLQKRYLVSKNFNEDIIVFNLSPVFKEYVKNCC